MKISTTKSKKAELLMDEFNEYMTRWVELEKTYEATSLLRVFRGMKILRQMDRLSKAWEQRLKEYRL